MTTHAEKRRHVRLSTKVSVKIYGPRMDLITQIARQCGMSLSEFVKMAALKEARLTLLEMREDRVEIAKEILRKEEERVKKEKKLEENGKSQIQSQNDTETSSIPE